MSDINQLEIRRQRSCLAGRIRGELPGRFWTRLRPVPVSGLGLGIERKVPVAHGNGEAQAPLRSSAAERAPTADSGPD